MADDGSPNTADLLLACVAGRMRPGFPWYRAPAIALDLLVRSTGQDFGNDVKKWRTWLNEHRHEFERVFPAALKGEEMVLHRLVVTDPGPHRRRAIEALERHGACDPRRLMSPEFGTLRDLLSAPLLDLTPIWWEVCQKGADARMEECGGD